MPTQKKYTLKDFHDDAARQLGSLPHIEKVHVETGWWYDAEDGGDRDTTFFVVAYTSFRDQDTGHDTKNVSGEGPTPSLAIEKALYSYRSAFGKEASAGIEV